MTPFIPQTSSNDANAKTRVRMCVIGLVMVAGLGVYQLLSGDTLVRQLLNMRRAERCAPAVRHNLAAFPEFRELRVIAYTGAGGSLMVEGLVKSESDMERIRDLAAKTQPTVRVVCQLRVFDTNEPR